VIPTILVVDPPSLLVRQLARSRFHVELAASASEAAARIAEVQPELVLVAFPRVGVELLHNLRERWPEAVCLAHLSESAGLAGTVEALQAGALDVISGTAPSDELHARLEKALEVADLRRSLRQLRLFEKQGRAELVGQSPSMQKVRALIREAGRVEGVAVLILGETGTGKELCARAVHSSSLRRERPFVVVNCTATSGAFESELFGCERTESTPGRRGLLELANGGSLLLDEIGDLELGLQEKLLRAFEEKRFLRQGGAREVGVDVRVIATSNRDLPRMAAAGQLRADLLLRLAGFEIRLPPLRERREDIPLLTGHFIVELAAELGTEAGWLDPRAEELLHHHPFPGNLRQLRNLIAQAMHLARGGPITAELLDGQAAGSQEQALAEALARVQQQGTELLEEEERLVRAALRRVDGNKTRAAALLQISRYALQRKLRRFDRDEETVPGTAEPLQ
jgi:DNA-binding NtrC family response regulator